MSARHARHTDAGAGLRLLRAALFAAVCVVLSALGHVLAACATVPWWTLLAGFLGVFALASVLAGRERSLPSIAGALAAGQLALHVLFGIGQHTAAAATARPTGDVSLLRLAAKLVCGPAATARLTASDARRIVTEAGLRPPSGALPAPHGSMTGMTPMPGMTDSASTHGVLAGLLPSLPMLLGHLLAALLTGWLLRRGEAALFALARLSAQAATAAAEGACVRSLRAAVAFVTALLAGLPGVPGNGPGLPAARLAIPLPKAGEALQHSVIRRGPPSAYALAV